MNYYSQVEKIILKEYNYNYKTTYGKNKIELETYYRVGKFLNKEIINNNQSSDIVINNYRKEIFKNTKIKYSNSDLEKMIIFYQKIENHMLLSNRVSWSHYKELIKLDNISLINKYINKIMLDKLSLKSLKELLKKETLN